MIILMLQLSPQNILLYIIKSLTLKQKKPAFFPHIQ